MKTCFKCNTAKPLTEFYKHNAMADGFLNKCIDCTKNDVHKHRIMNIEKIREYDRKRAKLPNRIQQTKEKIKKYQKLYPLRRAANIAVGNAIRDGILKKEPCLICGEKAHAHHPDYGRPLNVVWLCPKHHKEAHAIGK